MCRNVFVGEQPSKPTGTCLWPLQWSEQYLFVALTCVFEVTVRVISMLASHERSLCHSNLSPRHRCWVVPLIHAGMCAHVTFLFRVRGGLCLCRSCACVCCRVAKSILCGCVSGDGLCMFSCRALPGCRLVNPVLQGLHARSLAGAKSECFRVSMVHFQPLGAVSG